ncbi:MAG: DUF4440 domain-containing protein [Ignavibacteriaceae bacterium]
MNNVFRILTTVLIISLTIIMFDCKSENNSGKDKKEMVEKSKMELINTDTEFYNISQQTGTGQAFIDFADDDAVMLRQDNHPAIGKQNIRKLYKGKENNVSPLKWKPVKADVSEDGTMGFTYGNWEYAVRDEKGKIATTYGNYVTVWKKQSDGKWKYVLDGGNTTPPPLDK